MIRSWQSRPILLLATLLVACATDSPEQSGLRAALERSVAIYRRGDPVAGGSATLLADGSRALTCYHVIRHFPDEIEIGDGERRIAVRLLRQGEQLDLAILELPERWIASPLLWREREDLQIGESVYLIGSPYGLIRSYMRGSVAHIDRRKVDTLYPEIPFIQTDGISFPGASGAAVYDFNGRVIGVNRATYGLAPGSGIGLVIPAGMARVFVE